MRIVDTDVLIDLFHGHRAALEFIADVLTRGEVVALSVVAVSEILSGMRPGEEERTERVLGLFSILDVNEDIARRAGEYLRQYRRSHQTELGDALIAVTANVREAPIATRNVKHYPMTDVQVVVPYSRG
jgi:hypothetical protein